MVHIKCFHFFTTVVLCLIKFPLNDFWSPLRMLRSFCAYSVLLASVTRYPVPLWPLDPEWTSRIIFPRSEKQFFGGKKYFSSLMRNRIRDLESFDPGSGIRDGKNLDPQHWLLIIYVNPLFFYEQMEKPFGAHVFWLKEKDKEVPYAFLPVSVPEEGTLLFNMSIHPWGRIRIPTSFAGSGSSLKAHWTHLYPAFAAHCILHFTRRPAK